MDIDTLHTRLHRVYHRILLAHAALRAAIVDEDRLVSDDDMRTAAAGALAVAATDLSIVLLVPDVVLGLPCPTDDDCEREFPKRLDESNEDLRNELVLDAFRARCVTLAGRKR